MTLHKANTTGIDSSKKACFGQENNSKYKVMQFSGSVKFLWEVSKKGQFSNFCDDLLLHIALLK